MSISTLDEQHQFSIHGERTVPSFGDPLFLARTANALLLANLRYWRSVAPIVRCELARWEEQARTIDDPQLRAIALGKLGGESFHAEAATMLATLAPRAHRRDVVVAILALELLFDYLDGVTELPTPDPLTDHSRLFIAYWHAVALPDSDTPTDRHAERPDGHYLWALSDAVSSALARLPSAAVVTPLALANAEAAIQAQVRIHAVPQLGREQLETWAKTETAATSSRWREFLAASASSVLVVHALIAAAANPGTTREHAAQIARTYLSTCTVLTLLDGLVDYDQDSRAPGGTNGVHDRRSAGLGYIDLYPHPNELSEVLADAARRAAGQARHLPNAAHHVMSLVGVIAYYTSHPGARGQFAAPIAKRLRQEVSPLIHPTFALMRGWRLAKRIRTRRTPSIGVLT
jgi:tetraprenyl-beta-curcumene synthase